MNREELEQKLIKEKVPLHMYNLTVVFQMKHFVSIMKEANGKFIIVKEEPVVISTI